MNVFRIRFWVGFLMLMAGQGFANELAIARIFSDGVVLQREIEVPVWGTATPGAEVQVSFGDQVEQVKADAEGVWMLRLNSLEASEQGRVMTIRSEGTSIEIKDVLVGEVWLCGGQSNMAWLMARTWASLKLFLKDEPLWPEVPNETRWVGSETSGLCV